MTKRSVIIILILITILGVAWTLYHSPSKMPRSPVIKSSSSPDTMATVLEIARLIHCPDTCCQDKPIYVDQSQCQTAQQIREMILQMVRSGLDRKSIVIHLGMMGLLEDLPPGHPPVDFPHPESLSPDTSQSRELPSEHSSLP